MAFDTEWASTSPWRSAAFSAKHRRSEDDSQYDSDPLMQPIPTAYPNAAALALVPFERNIGSASAMLGFLQIGISSLASASVGLFASHTMLPIAAVMTATSWIGLPNRVEKFLASQARHRMFSGRAALPRSPNQSRRRSLQRPPSTAQPV